MHEAVPDNRAEREALRRRLRSCREALLPDEVRAASAAVCARIARLPAFGRAARVALYSAVRGEIDTSELHAALRARGATACYPRVAKGTGPALQFHAVAEVAALTPDAFQVPAPNAAAPEVALGDLALILVPAVAFDRQGFRLGYGRGYYDAALAAAPAALRIGLGHAFQLVDPFPRRGDDQPVDVVVTPAGVVATDARAAFPASKVLEP